MSPLALVSAGMAMRRTVSSPCGCSRDGLRLSTWGRASLKGVTAANVQGIVAGGKRLASLGASRRPTRRARCRRDRDAIARSTSPRRGGDRLARLRPGRRRLRERTSPCGASEPRRSAGSKRAIGVEPVGAAVERQARIVVAHLARQARDFAAAGHRADWRRSGRTGRRAPRAQSPTRISARLAEAERLDIGARHPAAPWLRSTPSPRAAGNSLSSAHSSAPEPTPRSSTRKGSPRRAAKAPAPPRRSSPFRGAGRAHRARSRAKGSRIRAGRRCATAVRRRARRRSRESLRARAAATPERRLGRADQRRLALRERRRRASSQPRSASRARRVRRLRAAIAAKSAASSACRRGAASPPRTIAALLVRRAARGNA